MLKFILLILLLLCTTASFAQISEAEFQAMQQKLQKMRDSVLKDPTVKKYLEEGSSEFTAPVKAPTAKPTSVIAGPDLDKLKMPKKDTAKIRRLPKKTLSLSELDGFMKSLYQELSAKFGSGAAVSAEAIAKKLGNDPAKLEAAAFHAWQKGAEAEAVLLITKSTTLGSIDGLLLTNAGAILHMNNLSDKAVPVLRSVVQYDPSNIQALNNLGQSYIALGLQDSGMHYITRCLQLSPEHPEANHTAGVIEFKKGNKGKAQTHFENSIRGGFNIPAYLGLKSILKEKCRIRHLIQPKVKMPEYFSEFRFKLPALCLNVQDAARAEEASEAFGKMLGRAIQAYQKLGKEAEIRSAARDIRQLNQSIMDKAMAGEPYLRPFQLLGGIMEAETIVELRLDRDDLVYFNKENRRQYKALEEQYKKDLELLRKKHANDDEDHECCGEGDISCCDDGAAFCKESNELKNRYLEQFNVLTQEWRTRNLQVELKHIDNLLFWCYFAAMDTLDYKVRFYGHVANYLNMISLYSQMKVLSPCHEEEAEDSRFQEPKPLKEFDCPVDIEIPFIVGKLALNCEKFSFKAGEGIVFKYEKKFSNRQSTITLGAGAGIDASWKLGSVKAGFETGMSMNVFLTFDKAGNCMDGGMMYKAYRGAGADFSAGEKIKIKKDLGHIGDEIGWRFGIHSGVSFTEPSNPYMIKQQEQPINKNVKIYQSGE